MNLTNPFMIGPRLLPALKVGDGALSLQFVGCADNRMVYRWYVDIPAGEFSEADLKTGIQGGGYQQMFGAFLAFLSAAADAAYWEQRTGRESENSDLFPEPVVEWAHQFSDELVILQCDIEDAGAVLISE